MIEHTDPERRDEGSILLLVLVLIVIVGLVVAPLMSYALSVHRASASQAVKSRDVEAAKGGVRRALAAPADLFDVCNSGSTNLGGPSMARSVGTTCQVVGTRRIKEVAYVPLSIASVQADAMTPVGYATNTYANENTFAEHDKWLTTSTYSTASTAGTVWVPDLAVRTTSLRPSTPVPMQAGAQNPGYATCDVFFPGTYQNALIVNAPTFFLSGVYYFEDTITFEAGADAVIGDGTLEGCTSDLEAVSYATTVPNPINGSGFGATFVLGDNARIVVDNSAGDVRVRFNQRYIGADEEGAAPSAGVSIVSVNGDHVIPGSDLDLTGVIAVPDSQVGGPSPEAASAAGYLASIHNSRPLPIAPANVTSLTTFQTATPTGGVTVGWTDPNLPLDADATGARITGYEVTSSPPSPSGPCVASVGPTGNIQPTCTFADLMIGQPYTFTVETLYDAARIAGAPLAPVVSAPSASATPLGTDPLASQPGTPSNVAVGASYDTGARIDWDPPASNGGAPINSYTVTATPVGPNPPVACQAEWDATSCVLPLLVPSETYDVEVVAGNRVTSLPPSVPGVTSFTFIATGTPVPTGPPAPSMPVRIPDPIIDFELTGPGEATVEVLGYVSVPQGHVRIQGTPSNSSVKFSGGAVAAMFRPIDGAGTLTALPTTFQLDLTNPITQKIIRLVSTTERVTATAIVQVNETGGWALNSLNVQ